MHPRVSVDQLCFPGTTLAQLADRVRALGAENVVLNSGLLFDRAGVEASGLASAGAPRIVAINHGFAIDPNLEDDEGQAGATLERLVPLAAELGADAIYLVTGGRGGLDWASASARFAELVAPGAQLARRHGLRLMIENTNGLYADVHIGLTLADTLAVAEQTGLDVCLELQFCWAEGHLAELVRRAVPRCSLVQVSDYVLGDRCVPGRAVPGDGAIPLERLLGELLDAGYEGMFDLELLGPRIDDEGHDAAVARAAEAVGSILARLGA